MDVGEIPWFLGNSEDSELAKNYRGGRGGQAQLLELDGHFGRSSCGAIEKCPVVVHPR